MLAPACLRTQLRLDEHAGNFRPALRAVALFFHPPATTQIIVKGLMTSPVTFSPYIGSPPGVPPVRRRLTSEAGPPRLRSRSIVASARSLLRLLCLSIHLDFRSAITPEHLVLPRYYSYFVLYPRAVDPFLHAMLISRAAGRSLVFILFRGRTVCPFGQRI